MTIICTCKAVEVGGKTWHQDGCPLRGTRKLGTTVKSVHLNTRDAGFENESNDCFVKALAAVTCVPYRDAHAFCATRMHRKAGRGTECMATMMAIETAKQTIYGFRIFSKTAQVGTISGRRWDGSIFHKPRYGTLVNFARTHRTGKWLVWSNYHAFAVIDGVVYDNGAAGPRTQVTGVYEFIESSKCEGR
jgi:hypothetical protein